MMAFRNADSVVQTEALLHVDSPVSVTSPHS